MSLLVPAAIALVAAVVIATKKSPAVANADPPAHPPEDGGATPPPPPPPPHPPTDGKGFELNAAAPWYTRVGEDEYVITAEGLVALNAALNPMRAQPDTRSFATYLDAYVFRSSNDSGLSLSNLISKALQTGKLGFMSQYMLDALQKEGASDKLGCYFLLVSPANAPALRKQGFAPDPSQLGGPVVRII